MNASGCCRDDAARQLGLLLLEHFHELLGILHERISAARAAHEILLALIRDGDRSGTAGDDALGLLGSPRERFAVLVARHLEGVGEEPLPAVLLLHLEGEANANSSLLLKEGSGKVETIKLAKADLPNPLTKAEIFAQNLKIKIGQPLPDFALKTLAGATSSMTKQRKTGRRALINIWATWCVPCANEMPELEKMRPLLAARGVDLIGLNVDAEKNADVKGYVAKKGVTYPILVGGVAAIEQVYATEELSVPLTILVDEKGIVRDLIPGWSAETRRKFAEMTGGETVKTAKSAVSGKANE